MVDSPILSRLISYSVRKAQKFSLVKEKQETDVTFELLQS